MPLPSEADLQAAIGKAIIMDKELYNYLCVTGMHWVTRDAAYLAAVPTDAQPAAQAAEARLRAMLAGATETLPSRLAPLWDTYRRVANLQPVGDFWEALTKYMIDNSKTVKSRSFSFGSWSTITGAGGTSTGAITRLTIDENNLTIESGFAEVKNAVCIADQNSGASRHEEVFRIYGATAGKDSLELIGTGKFIDIKALSPRSSSTIVPNPSFESVVEVSSVLQAGGIVGWTESAIANFVSVTSDYYRDNPGAATNRSLRLTTNASIKTSFSTLGISWNPRIPLYAQVAFKRESSCDGTLNIIIGGITSSVVLSAQSGWTILKFLVTTSAWFKNWNIGAPSGSLTNAAITILLRTT